MVLLVGGLWPVGATSVDVATAGIPNAESWAFVLAAHVVDGGIDYASLAADRDQLDSYLELIAHARVEEASPEEVLAFWINSYNAVVLAAVLEHYPEIASVMDVPGFFTERTTVVGGEPMTLDQIEARALDLAEPRVHFAVVCAARSCPPLRAEPFEAGRLEQQLAEQTRIFLADAENGMRLDDGQGILWLSSIFKWYAEDFSGQEESDQHHSAVGVQHWVAGHMAPEVTKALALRSMTVRYLDYDWTLNDRVR